LFAVVESSVAGLRLTLPRLRWGSRENLPDFFIFFWAANLPSDTRPKGLRNKELIEPDQVVSAEQAEEFSTTNHTTTDAEGRAGEPETAKRLEIDTAQVCAREGARLWGGHQPCGTQPVGRDKRGERGNIRARTPGCRGARGRWPQATRRARRAARRGSTKHRGGSRPLSRDAPGRSVAAGGSCKHVSVEHGTGSQEPNLQRFGNVVAVWCSRATLWRVRPTDSRHRVPRLQKILNRSKTYRPKAFIRLPPRSLPAASSYVSEI
jgi:hypothetical protein